MAKTVILANGVFPRRGSEPWQLLANATRVVACDGAADSFTRRFRREPDFIVGDMDSRHGDFTPKTATVVLMSDQNTNDLDKAIRFCRGRGWRDLVIVGATGKREDHTLGNVFRAMAAGIETVTEHGRFVPVAKSVRQRVGKGAAVSVFATDRHTRMRSTGLEWPLAPVRFENLYCATLNRATAAVITVSSTHPAFLYIARP